MVYVYGLGFIAYSKNIFNNDPIPYNYGKHLKFTSRIKSIIGMKTIKDVHEEIAHLQTQNEAHAKPSGHGLFGETTTIESNTDTRRNRKRIEFLRLVEIYLDSNPTEEFCQRERSRLHSIIDTAEASWKEEYDRRNRVTGGKMDNLPQTRITTLKNEYLKDVNLSELRYQINTLDYILS